MPEYTRTETTLFPSEKASFIDCDVCKNEVVETDLIHLDSGKLSELLKEYHIYSICKDCFEKAKSLFRADVEVFYNWLEEHDNREYKLVISDDRRTLRRGFNLNLGLLADDPEDYYHQLDRYASMSEDMLIWLMDRYNLDIEKILLDFKRHKVKML